VRPFITGSNFNVNDIFMLDEFSFHWGYNIFQGSEHYIDNQKFPLEVYNLYVYNFFIILAGHRITRYRYRDKIIFFCL
jgi:hypothetical protein